MLDEESRGSGTFLTKKRYLLGLVTIFVSAYSQYFIGGISPVLSTAIVYGVPLLVTTILFGKEIMRRAFNHVYKAAKYGLGFFGAFTVLGTIVANVVFLIITTFEPSAVNVLQRPNPVLNVSPAIAWEMVWVSLLVVGPVEEYLFRGYVYGGLLNHFKNHHWLTLAFVSSIMFAAAHLYYALVYGIVSLIQFTDLIAFGMAMAATFYVSGGNILVPALIHGAYDATGFIGIATSTDVASLLRGSMILVGVIVAIIIFLQRDHRNEPQGIPLSFENN